VRPAIAVALLAALAGWLGVATPAGACETEGTPLGLTLLRPLPLTLPQGGVLPLTAVAIGVDLGAELSALPPFHVTRDDVEVAGTLATVTIATGLDAAGLRVHELIQVWRPKAPLAVGDTLLVTYTDRYLSAETWPVTVTAPPEPVTLPNVLATGHSVRVDAGERVCCEILADSCDQTSLCQPTLARDIPALAVMGARLAGDPPQAWLWVARADAKGQPGPSLLRVPDADAPFGRPAWTEWSADISFPAGDAAPPYCVVVGTTSLIDGSRQVSEPLCVDAEDVGPIGTVELTPDLPAYAIEKNRECVSDPVYEADGSPYKAPAGGCAVAPRPAPAALLLLMLLLRRRRR
jgi:hypothetical protein